MLSAQHSYTLFSRAPTWLCDHTRLTCVVITSYFSFFFPFLFQGEISDCRTPIILVLCLFFYLPTICSYHFTMSIFMCIYLQYCINNWPSKHYDHSSYHLLKFIQLIMFNIDFFINCAWFKPVLSRHLGKWATVNPRIRAQGKLKTGALTQWRCLRWPNRVFKSLCLILDNF